MTDSLRTFQGRTVHMVRGGSAVLIGRKLGEGAQGVVHEASIAGALYAVKWFRPTNSPELLASIRALVEREPPQESFIWPIDVVESASVPGFGYVMPRLEPGFESFAQFLDGRAQSPFSVLITIGQQFVSAFHALHGSGLCYRDFNTSNLWVDPARAKVAIIDNDNVGLDSGRAMVLGTHGFMAPEIVRGEGNVLPSSVTDLHSLAVTLFYLFMHGHPLEGIRTERIFSWATSAESRSKLVRRHYGVEPLFIFHPTDESNRPAEDSETRVWWPIYPRFLRDLFEKAFTAGLSPGPLGRVAESEWRRALHRLADSLAVCSCNASVFHDPDDPGMRCWHCARVLPAPRLLHLPGRKVVLSEGVRITSHHVHRDGKDLVIAEVQAHPSRPGEVVLRNVGPYEWTMKPDGEAELKVAPGKRLHVRPMSIEFGRVTGRVTVD